MGRLEWEVQEARDSIDGDRWLVEAIDDESEGECYVTSFSGPEAEARAREYAAFKNHYGAEHWRCQTCVTRPSRAG